MRFINAVGKNEPMVIATFGNGTGKTHGLVSIWSAIMFPTENPLFSASIYHNWPYPKVARLNAPETLLRDSGVIQRLISKLFPAGQYEQAKEKKSYYAKGKTTTGWTWDVMTYDQKPLQAAGDTVGLMLYSEPPPYALHNENAARLRAGGIEVMECTPLFYAPYLKDDFIDTGVFKTEDGKELGKVLHVTGDIWDNCDENPGGRLSRGAIEITISRYPVEERELRVKGKFGHLQGLVFKTFSKEAHVLPKLEGYHLECMQKGRYTLRNVVDPHDRKPYAVGWYATFPNEDTVAIAEFPDDTYPNFYKMDSFPWRTCDYGEMIRATEQAIFTAYGAEPSVPVIRWIDPNFGRTQNFSSKKTIQQEFKEWGEAEGYPMDYAFPGDSVADGHMAIRSLLGEPDNGVRPKFYMLEHCVNHVYSFTHYAWKENTSESKGKSETPQLVYKDFIDLVRYPALMGFTYEAPPERGSEEMFKLRSSSRRKK